MTPAKPPSWETPTFFSVRCHGSCLESAKGAECVRGTKVSKWGDMRKNHHFFILFCLISAKDWAPKTYLYFVISHPIKTRAQVSSLRTTSSVFSFFSRCIHGSNFEKGVIKLGKSWWKLATDGSTQIGTLVGLIFLVYHPFDAPPLETERIKP